MESWEWKVDLGHLVLLLVEHLTSLDTAVVSVSNE